MVIHRDSCHERLIDRKNKELGIKMNLKTGSFIGSEQPS